jgi:hypothetical protein
METFYSIIYIKPNSLTDEHLAVAIFLGGGEGPYFYLSNKRMKLLENTSHKNTFLSLQRHLKSLKQKVDNYRKSNKELMLFDPQYSQEEFSRLNKLSKGTILYSEPVSVNEWLDEAFFNRFVYSFLGEKVTKSKRNRPVFQFMWRAFCHSNKFLDWEKDIPVNELNDSVGLTFKIDLVNHSKKIAVKTIDFNLSQENIAKKKFEVQFTAQLIPDYKLICVYPTLMKTSSKTDFQSTNATLKHISFIKFSEFKLNH